MQLSDLEAIQVAWGRLPAFAQDAYEELSTGVRLDEYSDTIWRNVLWYLGIIEKRSSPADTSLRQKVREHQIRVKTLLNKRTQFGVAMLDDRRIRLLDEPPILAPDAPSYRMPDLVEV